MTDDSLPDKADPDPAVKNRPPPVFPVEGHPGSYVIEGELVTPETRFSYAKRLKGNPYLRAKAYALAECLRKHGALICTLAGPLGREPQPHYLTERTATVHHGFRKDCHIAKTLSIACISCNAVHGDPLIRSTNQSETREREGSVDILTQTQKDNSSSEIKISSDIYPIFCRWLKDEIGQNHKISVNDAISGGAKHMRLRTGHGSKQSARNYLDMESSKEGDYEIIEGFVTKRDEKVLQIQEQRPL